VLHAQCSRIVHRGPDDEGVFCDGDFGFGMRRLSVVDVEGGHQPMVSADGRYVIVFNGEVYNFRELQRELAALGRRFHSRSDTEVVLEAFSAWGPDCWSRLEGMFGVAVWDRHRRVLSLARDPLGIKPLYWTLQDGALAFASELKALEPVPGLSFDPCPLAIDQFLALGAVLTPRSIYRQVHKLEPGARLEIGPAGEPVISRFWRLRLQPRSGVSVPDWIEACRTQLLDSVRSHLVADVPLGAFLSGGVDSAAVVAAMSRVGAAPVRTFTIGFDEAGFDESAAAARVAAHLGCRHTERRLSPGAAAQMLDRLAPGFDEPFADDSVIPTWFVAQLAREQVTVALSGDGGDEVFAGYRRYRTEAVRQRLMRLPGAPLLLAGAQRLPGLPGPFPRQRAYLAKLAAATACPDPAARFLMRQVKLDTALRQGLYSATFAARLPPDEPFARWAGELRDEHWPATDFDAVLHADTTVWLPDDMLTKVDRMSMAHSLEVRVPMLSHRFVDWTAGVPRELKLRGDVGKWLLRQAVAPWLPPGAVDRPKQGFSVPLATWMAGSFGDHVARVWHEAGMEQACIFRPGSIETLIEQHRRGAADHGRTLFTLMMLAYWWRGRLRPLPATAAA
jgi:asparagine synthase (glutamine-hydrolysing)